MNQTNVYNFTIKIKEADHNASNKTTASNHPESHSTLAIILIMIILIIKTI